MSATKKFLAIVGLILLALIIWIMTIASTMQPQPMLGLILMIGLGFAITAIATQKKSSSSDNINDQPTSNND